MKSQRHESHSRPTVLHRVDSFFRRLFVCGHAFLVFIVSCLRSFRESSRRSRCVRR